MPGDPSPSSPDLRRSAKQLRRAIVSGEPAAILRAKAVFADLASMKPVEFVAHATLRRCQHIVAHEAGHASWAAAMQASAAAPARRKFVVRDEFWDHMHEVGEEYFALIRETVGVPAGSWQVCEDGTVFCARSLAVAIVKAVQAGEVATPELVLRLLPGARKTPAEAVACWRVRADPYDLLPVDSGYALVHVGFQAELPTRYATLTEANDALGRLLVGERIPVPAHEEETPEWFSWLGQRMRLRWPCSLARLAKQPIASATPQHRVRDGEVAMFSDVQAVRTDDRVPFISDVDQRAIIDRQRAWELTIAAMAERCDPHSPPGLALLEQIPWHTRADQTDGDDPETVTAAAEVRTRCGLPASFPDAVLATYQFDLSRAHMDDAEVPWIAIGAHLVLADVAETSSRSALVAGLVACNALRAGHPWRDAVAIGVRCSQYDKQLQDLVRSIAHAVDYVQHGQPVPRRTGPVLETAFDNWAQAMRGMRHHPQTTDLVSQSPVAGDAPTGMIDNAPQESLTAVMRHGIPAPRQAPSIGTLTQAAEHLRVHAEELHASHSVQGVWGTDPDAVATKAEVEEMFALADALDPPPLVEPLPKPTNAPA